MLFEIIKEGNVLWATGGKASRTSLARKLR